jgi:predicted Zn-dependent protease
VEGFRWTKFPLKVLVDMNRWSTSDYAFAVREAVDTWLMSAWAYSNLFNETTLETMSYEFYVSNINATTNCDIFITFTANEISQNVVGLTTYQWNPVSHEPVSPVTINLTTYSRTASHLFVENVAMHEFGHALGLGHASSQNTQNGPELMYFSTTIDSTVYPSTLDLYALTMVYKGNFNRSVQLPTTIPYEMVQPTGSNPPNPTPSPIQPSSTDVILSILKGLFAVVQHVWETNRTDLIILVVSLLTLILVKAMCRKPGLKE